MLPSNMSGTEQKCLSFALKNQIQKIIEKANATRTQSGIDQIPEKVLDILAVELRAPYYREEMNIDIKRNIIKNTMLWSIQAGTPAAVEELARTVFGEGTVREWFEYGGKPGTFRVETNAIMTEDIYSRFGEMIRRVKNVRSHLETISIHRVSNETIYTGTAQSNQHRPAAIVAGGYKEIRAHPCSTRPTVGILSWKKQAIMQRGGI